MSDLYDADVVEWSEQQATLLRRMGAGERVNDQVDWENVAEEIESVGNEQMHAVRSLLMRALEHDLKCEAWPLSRDVPHWRAEARRFRIEAADRFTPAMRAKIDVAVLYRRALRLLPETMDGAPPLPVPAEGPTLEEMLAEPPDA
jgi:Domain of unknown function DUF29